MFNLQHESDDQFSVICKNTKYKILWKNQLQLINWWVFKTYD